MAGRIRLKSPTRNEIRVAVWRTSDRNGGHCTACGYYDTLISLGGAGIAPEIIAQHIRDEHEPACS
jgi:hypothetical protein